jgi:hypothetical protein
VIGIGIIGVFGAVAVGAAVSNASDQSPKVTHLQNAIAHQLQAEATHPKVPVPPPASPPGPAPVMPSGIFSTHEGPFSDVDFSVSNAYALRQGSQVEEVFAGAVRARDGSGALQTGGVRVYLFPADPSSGGASVYVGQFLFGPAAGTSLSVVSAAGNVLTLQAGSNITVTFDLSSHVFAQVK